MSVRLFISAVAVGLAGVSAAQAEGYSISDLGTMSSKDACMAQAKRVLTRYQDNFGAHVLDFSSWSAYGWDLRPGDQDVVITCASASDSGRDTRRAVLVVYGEAGDGERKATREIIKSYWRE